MKATELVEWKGQTFSEPEPKLIASGFWLNVLSLIFLALGLLIRGLRSFGLVAGLPIDFVVSGTGLALFEAITIELGVAISTVGYLFFWDGKSLKSWEFFGLVAGGLLEGFNSYLSAHLHLSQGIVYLVNEQATVGVLSFGAVIVWIVSGKIFSIQFHAWQRDWNRWYKRLFAWRNDLAAEERERSLKRRAENRLAREKAAIDREESANIRVGVAQVREWLRKYRDAKGHEPNREAFLTGMGSLGIDLGDKNQRDKASKWYREEVRDES